MTRLLRISGRQVVAALQRAGFEVVHTRGSHVYLRRGEGALVTVPVHGKHDLPLGTLRSIMRRARLTEEELRALL